MRFGNVDNQEGNVSAVLLVKFVEGRNLPPERRSGVAAEYQNHGLLLAQRRELNSLALIQFEQREVWRAIAHVKRSGACVDPCSLKRKDQEGDRAGHPGHDATESFRRLMHRPPDIAAETDVSDRQAGNQRERERASEWTRFQH